MKKNFGLATFGKNFGKSTSANVAKVIRALYKIVNQPNYLIVLY